MSNKIWIELEAGDTDRVANAELATRVLHKLGFNESVKFWWDENKNQYGLTINGAGEFLTLSDNGHWFNLDFAAE